MKRSCDFVLAGILILIVALLLGFLAMAIRFTSNGPALFWSDRVGRHGSIFRMPKLRTMKLETPLVATASLTNPDAYLTPIGKFLRRSSLDELPQLWSILKGEMSFVGPRPALIDQHDLIRLRNGLGIDALLPGLTGWAQVNGRDDCAIGEKVRLDFEYLHRQSRAFDAEIICLTVIAVVHRTGISH